MFQGAADVGSARRSFAGRNISLFHVTPERALTVISGADRNIRMFHRRPVGGRTVGAMRTVDVEALIDFTYWADRQILQAATALPVEDFTRSITITYRDLRGTLVHTLDVELSWRRRLRGEPKEIWDTSLSVDDYPTADVLAEHWARDEIETRDWLASLTDEDLGAIQDLGDGDRFPLWYYLVHIVTHSEQQRRDAQLILRHLGHEPPDLEFLYYADSLVEPGASPSGSRRG